MSRSLGLTIILYALAVAGVCAFAAVTGRRRSPSVNVGLVLLELAAMVQAALDGLQLIRGQHGPDVATNVGYLITSLIVLPFTCAAVRLDPGRWGSAALAVGCVLLAVVSLRLHQTLGSAHA